MLCKYLIYRGKTSSLNLAETELKKEKVSATDCTYSITWDCPLDCHISKIWPRIIRLIKSLLESAIFHLLHRMLSSFVARSLKSYGILQTLAWYSLPWNDVEKG